MIWTLAKSGLVQLSRSRIELVLTFGVPIAFFSIFALIFGNQGGGSKTPKISIAIVDQDQTSLSRRFVAALRTESHFRNYVPPQEASKKTASREGMSANDSGQPADEATQEEPALTAEAATQLVKQGTVKVAIVLPSGFGESFADLASSTRIPVDVYVDSSDPIAAQVVAGMLQKIAITSIGDVFIEQGLEQFKRFAGPLTLFQQQKVDQWLPLLRQQFEPKASQQPESESSSPTAEATQGSKPGSPKTRQNSISPLGDNGIVPIQTHDVLGETKKNPMIAYYAAGIAVMFLLFSASGAGGSLLEEVETGTLERLLSTDLSMTQLLLGKWLMLVLMGITQVTIMFVWGQLVFDLELTSHLPGFVLMTLATTAAAASFGMLLATACRSRGQLSGISTIVILSMSALGGSMVPRFIMSDTMQKLGRFTFNAWALEGYQDVFWRDLPLWELRQELAFLTTTAVVLLIVARLLARRWETV